MEHPKKRNNMSQKEERKRPQFFLGIRQKLISIFILIKVLPLIALALFAAKQIDFLGFTVRNQSTEMVSDTRELVGNVGTLAVESSISALDLKSRETIERLTTDTAQAVARFLYDRDLDIQLVAGLDVTEEAYRRFIEAKQRPVIYHRPWTLSDDGSRWVEPATEITTPEVKATVKDNQKDFHARPPDQIGFKRWQPLYHEITFIDLDGVERVKVNGTELLPKDLRDVSVQENTWCKAEKYFAQLQELQPGEIYVSRVIGPYLGSPMIGPYTRKRAEERGITFSPETAAYAGKENPLGKRFEAIIRWATPVYQNGKKIGYVTLALDHTHLMEFTDHLIPTDERYSAISDAGSGNYAFMWDYKGRNISHPRDYFIVGFDPETGEQAIPWLSSELYQTLQDNDGIFSKFEQVAPTFLDQALTKKPTTELTKAGQLALDCRYLNFAPQCTGWMNLTQYGGSGSFVIFWSKLWKLTTAAAIPYYTGVYGDDERGFGFVTIGANVNEFHRAATVTAAQIEETTKEYEISLDQKAKQTLASIDQQLRQTITNLSISTAIMVFIVILIAIWMAATLTRKIVEMIKGIQRFQDGKFDTRLKTDSHDEVGQLAQAFNEMSDSVQDAMTKIREAKVRAEESDRAKSLFLANMSHEIRTPMNAIIGMSRLALAKSEDKEQQNLLDSVKNSADSLLAVINDILDFSKIEAGQLDLEQHTFSPRAMVRSVIKLISVLAEEKGLGLRSEIDQQVPELVSGDAMRLRQILLNLLGNGIKFTNDGEVVLKLSSNGWQGDTTNLQFEIHDTGEGISPENQERIFERFTQEDLSISRKYQGTGLGLAISKNLCQLMGGDIRVSSEPGKGSTFTFTVQMHRPQERPARQHRTVEPDNTTSCASLDILLVEDNEANRMLATMVLEGLGHSVASAESGLECLQLLAQKRYAVIIMDIQMPEMDGFTATRVLRACEQGVEVPIEIDDTLEARLRQNLAGEHQPIIALTAHAMKGDRERCMEAGVDSYMTKPFLPDQVKNALQPYCCPSEGEESADRVSPREIFPSVEQIKGELRSTYGLDDSQLEGLLPATLAIIREDLDRLATAAAQRDLHLMAGLANSLHGALVNIRLEEGAILAKELHTCCTQKDAEDALKCYNDFNHWFASFPSE